ncbi:MAG: hypothetical protein AAGU27_10545 [Dehalobacterium sp.]
MKLIKSCKIWSLVLALTIVFTIGVVAFADEPEVDVYLTVERTLLGGQAPILAPTKVTVPAGSDVLDVLQAAKTQNLLDFTYRVTELGEYVTGFKVTSHGAFDPFTDYAYYDEFDAAAGGMGDIYLEYGTTPQNLFLTEGNYCMLGGWIVSLNDVIEWDDDSTEDVNEAMPTMATIVEDNDVLQFQYSLALARDAGFEGWSLLTLRDLAFPFYERADKRELVRAMADNGVSDPAYAGAMSVLMDMEATPAEVTAAVNAFN